MPPTRYPRAGRTHVSLPTSNELVDKRRISVNGVNKSTRPPAAQACKHSLRQRLAIALGRQDDPPRPPTAPREPTPAPEDPTDAYFSKLRRDLDARHADDGDGRVALARNSSSPPLPEPKLPNVNKLEVTYEARAHELEIRSKKKIDEAYAVVQAMLDALKQNDKEWVASVHEHQKWTIKPLPGIKLDLGPQGGQIRLGGIAKNLCNKLGTSVAEVGMLWDEWEALDHQITQLCTQLGGGVDGRGQASKSTELAAQIARDIRRAISEAEAELQDLGDAACREAEKTEKDIHARWKKERARIQQNEAKAADNALFG